MKLTLNDVTLDDITLFLERKSSDVIPEYVEQYLNMLDKIRGMLQRFDMYPNDELIIKHLMIKDNLSRYKANDLLAETRMYFYCDQKVSKDAWRNILSEKMDKVIHFAMLTMKDPADADRVTKMIQRQAYLLRLDKDDVEEYPAEFFQKPWVVYTTDVEALGLPKVNRNRIKEFIDNKVPELTEKERNRLYQEADIIPFKALPNDEENPRKN